MPYKRYLRDQLSTALDVYFMILRIIDSRLLSELKRDGPDWRLKNACPPCTYMLDDEPKSELPMLICGDGNTLLKQYLRPGENDPRRFTSTYMLEPEEVDKYKLDKPSRRRAGPTGKQPEVEKSDDAQEDDLAPPSACAPCWKNAQNEDGKSSFDALDETGIFVVLCRHGRVLVAADMIKTGERSKYPLATFSKVIRTRKGKVIVAYDIACQHATTALNHPLTGDLVREKDTDWIGTQPGVLVLVWRTLQAASDSSAIRMQIDEHFEVSDQDVLANMGKFLYNNFVGAMSQLEESLECRNQAMDAFNIREEDFRLFVDAERAYLASTSSASLDKSDAIELVEALESMADLQNQLDQFLSGPASSVNQDKPVDIDKAIATKRRNLTSRLSLAYQTVHTLELKLEVNKQWTSDCPEWKQAVADRLACELQSAVDKMEQLCIERIFELEKYLNGNTTRSKALKSAVSKYNKLALKFDLPRRQITTREVMDMANLSDFQLLREHRHEILSEKWALPEIRQATMHALRVDRAREELVRVQIEARRLQTWMRDDLHHMDETLKRLEVENSLLASALRPRIIYQARVNESIYAYIQRIESSDYFDGKRGPGSQKTDADHTGFTTAPHTANIAGDTRSDARDHNDESDDDIETEMANLTEAFDKIAHVVHT
ncbi:hypothetical protein FS749_003179 [Ceratobasidium sp. UAMH 11750]|nr:hypothetical protein FS749_003179 [Ceratobasidium sp. UAMH 11750]